MKREEVIDFLECRRAYYASLSTDPNPDVKATKVCGYTLAESANACLMAIEALEQPKTGHWIPKGIGDGFKKWNCSKCGMIVRNSQRPWYKHCPNCGAKMAESEVRHELH